MNFIDYNQGEDFKDFDDTCWLTLKRINEKVANIEIKKIERRKAKAAKAAK